LKKKAPLSDSELIQLFRELPKARDDRHPEEIYDGVMKTIDDVPSFEVARKWKRNLWPMFATLAILMITFAIGSNFLKKNEDMPMLTTEEEYTNDKIVLHTPDMEDPNSFMSSDTYEYSLTYIIQKGARAVYPQHITGNELVVTLNIPDLDTINLIPVSFIVEQRTDMSWIDYVNKIMVMMNEENLSLQDYYPYDGYLDMDPKGCVTMHLFSSHGYNFGSAEGTLFFKTLEQFSSYGVKEVLVYEGRESRMYSTHLGEDVYTHQLQESNHRPYLFFDPSHQKYLVPSPDPVSSIAEAFEVMKSGLLSYNLKPSIPSEFEFKFEEQREDLLLIRFTSGGPILEGEESERMIEAILLTAKEFGYSSVSFENTGVTEIGTFHFEKSISVPVAPNLVGILH